MKRNIDPKFVGLPLLKLKQRKTISDFRLWSKTGWEQFHLNHYDWWMFPIDEPSTTWRFGFTVYEEDARELREDVLYLDQYREGMILLALSWGWDLEKAKRIPRPSDQQCWRNWPIRLYKATKSAQLFGEESSFHSLREYGRLLLDEGVKFMYSGDPEKDLTSLFMRGP